MNPNLPLETFIPPSSLSNVHILLSKDMNGLNNGNFFIRVHPWSVELLNTVIAYPFLNPGVEILESDQTALWNVLDKNAYFARSTVYCPLRWFNPYRRSENGELPTTEPLPDNMLVHPGDLLVHFPGTGERLGAHMYPYIAISRDERSDWSMPLKETGYIEETALFWDKFSSAPIEDA